jgi:hypothetical protein
MKWDQWTSGNWKEEFYLHDLYVTTKSQLHKDGVWDVHVYMYVCICVCESVHVYKEKGKCISTFIWLQFKR